MVRRLVLVLRLPVPPGPAGRGEPEAPLLWRGPPPDVVRLLVLLVLLVPVLLVLVLPVPPRLPVPPGPAGRGEPEAPLLWRGPPPGAVPRGLERDAAQPRLPPRTPDG